VKISTNWSLVLTYEITISPLMVLDAYVFGSRILTKLVSNLYGTLIVT
jgi:hypothetical protein